MKDGHGLCLARRVAASAALLAACGGDPGSGPDAGLPDAGSAPDADPRVDPDASAADAAVGGGEPAYLLTGDVQIAAVRGGEDGDPYQLICPTGFIAVGLEGSSGSRVDSLRLVCRELLEDGSLGDERHTTAEAGEANDNPFSVSCPDGEAIVAVRGREGGDIDAIGIDCASVAPWVDEGRGRTPGEAQFGGTGGRDFLDLCSRGYFVAEIAGQHASIIHGLQIRCDRVVDENDTTTPGPFARGTETEELPPRGGQDRRSVSVECDDDELPIGYLGRAASRLDRLQLVCGTLAEDGSLTESGTSVVIGGTGGDEFEEYCPEDEAIVGLRGRAGSQIDALGLVCAPVAGRLEDQTGVHPWGRLRGGTGGDAFDDVCPEGMFLRDITADVNGVIEAVTGRCVQVNDA